MEVFDDASELELSGQVMGSASTSKRQWDCVGKEGEEVCNVER